MRDDLLKQAKRVVIKIGTSLIASRGAGLRLDRIERLADEIAVVRKSGREVLLVSSGAIVSGIQKLGLKDYPKSLPLKQAAAAVGQSRLMWAYEKAFERVGQKAAQILLTHQDLTDRRRFLNARHTLTALLEFGVIPVINENDTVAVDEIRFGDNDSLAAMVAHLVDADLLIILSDVDGLFTEDPRHHPGATLIPVVTEITKDLERRAGVSSSFEGTGGMATKVQAAKKVAEYGVAMLILNGDRDGLLPAVFEGAAAGTFFMPRGRRLTSRKHWIAFTLRAKGQIAVDDGAMDALVSRGKSLLASGIVSIHGDFGPGDAVTCTDRHGKEFAKGLVNFSSDTLAQIKGLKTADIQKVLGTQEYEEVIHRDNLVIL
ncbi:MAG TPA: glutamate 5-kinase [Nitrospiraceae bacterium]|nr:glutamate 5-kinase [Nitrospiraceae bacterium]